jgi:23S rRNA (cytosine1962-C5)-methyltransferase
MKPRRYQLRKEAVGVVERGHPWIFRDQLSSAAGVFRDGDWLRLVDGANRIVAHGSYESEGAIAIRILRRGAEPPDAAWLRAQLDAAIARREPLAARTTGIRLVHGESDGIPAVVIDRFADTLVVSSYSAGADAMARYLARLLAPTNREVGEDLQRASRDPEPAPRAQRDRDPSLTSLTSPSSLFSGGRGVLLRPAKRRRGDAPPPRWLYGEPRDLATFVEDGLVFAVDLEAGQKTGTYLDLRGLRRSIADAPLAGARVLNLFAYSGMLGRAAEHAGAASITQVDVSERALAFAKRHHVGDPSKHAFVVADVFEWLPALGEASFELIVVDPPSMTSNTAQVPKALAAYRKLYREAAKHVAPGGAIVAACCTSRIARAEFHRVVREALGERFSRERELAVEVDHPVGFREADYLKIAWWRAAR